MTATVSDRRNREAPAAERQPAFNVHVSVAGRAVLARIRGPLDLHYTPRMVDGLESFLESANRVIVDLRSSEYIDGTGVRALLSMHKSLESARGELRLVVQPGSRVERVIRLLRLESHFAMFASPSEAWNADRAPESRTSRT